MNVPVALSLSERVALILNGLCQVVAARVFGGGVPEALIVLIWRRVRRVEGRLQGLLARFRAGRPMVLRARTAPLASGIRRTGSSRLPRRFGWLLELVPTHAAGYASQLRAVLEEAEVQALLAASPQARRVLAPVCRMLAIEASVLGPVAVRPARGLVTRVRARDAVPERRVALPRGVVSWAPRAAGR